MTIFKLLRLKFSTVISGLRSAAISTNPNNNPMVRVKIFFILLRFNFCCNRRTGCSTFCFCPVGTYNPKPVPLCQTLVKEMLIAKMPSGKWMALIMLMKLLFNPRHISSFRHFAFSILYEIYLLILLFCQCCLSIARCICRKCNQVCRRQIHQQNQATILLRLF